MLSSSLSCLSGFYGQENVIHVTVWGFSYMSFIFTISSLVIKSVQPSNNLLLRAYFVQGIVRDTEVRVMDLALKLCEL